MYRDRERDKHREHLKAKDIYRTIFSSQNYCMRDPIVSGYQSFKTF
jgi:hypothetical protein